MKTFSGKNAGQREYELSALLKLFKAEGITSYLEVGTRYGDTFHDVVSQMPVGSRAVSVDMPGAMWGGSHSSDYLEKAADDLRAKGYDITLIYGDSTDRELVSKVYKLAPFDACLIDGDHRLKGVLQDWMNYGTMCKIAAFHDIASRPPNQTQRSKHVEVYKLWDEIKKTHKTVEFIEDGSGMGIGVCYVR